MVSHFIVRWRRSFILRLQSDLCTGLRVGRAGSSVSFTCDCGHQSSHPGLNTTSEFFRVAIVFFSSPVSVWYISALCIFCLSVEILPSFIHCSPDFCEHLHVGYSNSLSGKSYNSVSLGSIPGDLACSLVRNLFTCFLIVLDSLCWWLWMKHISHLTQFFVDWPHPEEDPHQSAWPEIQGSPRSKYTA